MFSRFGNYYFLINNGWLHDNVGIRSLDALICKSIF